MFHITTEYTEQIWESLSGIMRVVTLVKPLSGKTEKILHEFKRLSGQNTQTTLFYSHNMIIRNVCKYELSNLKT